MVVRKFFGSAAGRFATVGSLVAQAKRALDRGNRLRAVGLLVVAALAWKWAILGVVAHGIIKLLRGGRR